MKKLFCVILILLLAAVCACSLAEDAPPTLQFAEEERINFKPIITGNRPELAVDTWLQQMAVLDEDYFWSVDPNGPKYSFKHVDGPVVKAHIDKENVLRMDTILKKPCKVTFELTVKWAGQTAKTNMYVEFFTCNISRTFIAAQEPRLPDTRRRIVQLHAHKAAHGASDSAELLSFSAGRAAAHEFVTEFDQMRVPRRRLDAHDARVAVPLDLFEPPRAFQLARLSDGRFALDTGQRELSLRRQQRVDLVVVAALHLLERLLQFVHAEDFRFHHNDLTFS